MPSLPSPLTAACRRLTAQFVDPILRQSGGSKIKDLVHANEFQVDSSKDMGQAKYVSVSTLHESWQYHKHWTWQRLAVQPIPWHSVSRPSPQDLARHLASHARGTVTWGTRVYRSTIWATSILVWQAKAENLEHGAMLHQSLEFARPPSEIAGTPGRCIISVKSSPR